MEWRDYLKKIRDFAVYPDALESTLPEVMYLTIGLVGEAGEIANKVKKLYRDGDSFEARAELRKEIGDLVWYLVRLIDCLGFDLEMIMEQNYHKLNDRKERGVLKGSGDNR